MNISPKNLEIVINALSKVLLTDSNDLNRAKAAESLGKIGNEKAIIYLVEALEKDDNSEIKPQIMDAIVAIFNYENELKQPEYDKIPSITINLENKAMVDNKEEKTIKNVEVEMNVTGGEVTGMVGKNEGVINVDQSQQNQNLADAAKEIQQLLQQLSQDNPTNTTTEQMIVAAKVIEKIENNSPLKQRLINAAKEGSLAALEKSLDNPIGAFVVNAIKGWTAI